MCTQFHLRDYFVDLHFLYSLENSTSYHFPRNHNNIDQSNIFLSNCCTKCILFFSFKAFVQQPWFIKQLGWKIVMYIIHTFLLMACMQSGNVMIWKTISPFSLVLCRRQQRHHGQWGPWNCIRTFQWYPSWWLTVLVLCSVWIIFLKHGMSVVYNDLFTRSIVLDIRDMSIAFLLII